jgi:hypothetical protein
MKTQKNNGLLKNFILALIIIVCGISLELTIAVLAQFIK